MNPITTVSGFRIELHADPGATPSQGIWRGDFMDEEGNFKGSFNYDAATRELHEVQPGKFGSRGFLKMAQAKISHAIRASEA
jgi:hypothetical protein